MKVEEYWHGTIKNYRYDGDVSWPNYDWSFSKPKRKWARTRP